jgi:hypothetical protein
MLATMTKLLRYVVYYCNIILFLISGSSQGFPLVLEGMAPPSGTTNTLSQPSSSRSLTMNHSLAAMDVDKKVILTEAASGSSMGASPLNLNSHPAQSTKMGILKCPEVCYIPPFFICYLSDLLSRR